ncbi:pyridoxal-phosphate dependent enzyme [Acidiplasma sp.]|uniref:pyridoxal-phosphate dependent enzyme n=1 Tax=Acidiplasma sp. TaxID=1872114 RepID=UPI002586CF60|nr:pyridoxal-phosphate dependent enzyme [Acidiplasma sp.]
MEIDMEEKPPGRPLIKDSDLGNFLKRENIYFKYEGYNPTGTQKDRISENHVKNAIAHGYDTISVATCGNYGASIAYYARKYGLHSVIGIPSDYISARRDEISYYGGEIIEKPVKYEEMVDYIRELSASNGWYDASPGSANSKLDYYSYSTISEEIYNELGRMPEYFSVPVGNGTTMYGVYLGFKRISMKTGEKIPSFIANSTINGNPIIYSFLRGYKKIRELNPDNIQETKINEPLVAYRSYDGQKALNVLYETHGRALYSTDEEMLYISKELERRDGLSVLPASCSAVSGALRVVRDETCVILLTGRN